MEEEKWPVRPGDMMPPYYTRAEILEQAWTKVVGRFREMCILRKQHRGEEAKRMLEEAVPLAIHQWSELCRETPAWQRRELERMFREEEKRIDESWALQRLFARRFAEQARLMDSRGASGLFEAAPPFSGAKLAAGGCNRARGVSLDNIPEMIDLVLAVQALELRGAGEEATHFGRGCFAREGVLQETN